MQTNPITENKSVVAWGETARKWNYKGDQETFDCEIISHKYINITNQIGEFCLFLLVSKDWTQHLKLTTQVLHHQIRRF
jgi:hypothetical protein